MSYKVGFVSFKPKLITGFLDDLWHSLLPELVSITKFKPEIIYLDSTSSISDEERRDLEQLDVMFSCQSTFKNKQIFPCLGNLKWLQLYSAGVEKVVNYYKDKPKPGFVLTRNAGFFDSQMCHMTMAWICARERKFEEYKNQQALKIWKPLAYRTMEELSVGVVGFGSIGKKLAKMCINWEANVMVLVRDAKDITNGESKRNDYEDITTTSSLSTLLSSCHYIISILPSTPQTNNIFDAEILKNCSTNKSVFINLGRGNVVSEESILQALNNKWISHAMLDVFPEEPLPTGSRLWSRDDVTIMPHVSGRKFPAKKRLGPATLNLLFHKDIKFDLWGMTSFESADLSLSLR